MMSEMPAHVASITAQLRRRDAAIAGFARVLSDYARLKKHTNRIAQDSGNVEAEVAQLRTERVGLIAARDVTTEQASGSTEALAQSKELDLKISRLSAQLIEAHKQVADETQQQLGLHRQVDTLDQTLAKKMEMMQALAPRCARLEEENLLLEQKLEEGNEAVESINKQRSETTTKLTALREELRLLNTKYSTCIASGASAQLIEAHKQQLGLHRQVVSSAARTSSAGAAAFAAGALAKSSSSSKSSGGGSSANASRSPAILSASAHRSSSFSSFGGDASEPLPPPPSIDPNDGVMKWLQTHLEATPTVPGWLAIKTTLIERFGGAELDAHKVQVREMLSYHVLKQGRMLKWLQTHLDATPTVPTWLVVKEELVARFGQAEFDLHKEEARTRLIAKAEKEKEKAKAAAAATERTASPISAFTVDIGGGGRASTATQLLPASTLTPFDVVDSCMRCGVSFGFFKQKCHCYVCGSVTCRTCSPNKFVPALDTKIRVCIACEKPNNNG